MPDELDAVLLGGRAAYVSTEGCCPIPQSKDAGQTRGNRKKAISLQDFPLQPGRAPSLPVCKDTLRQSSSPENSVRLLNSALFTPDSWMRKISSSKPEPLRSFSDTALSKTLKGLYQTDTAECPFTR
ncbi:hypothetical protein NQZ68_001476 [Dissostichus eleginoides]|nr:hypothetical protein NQZ68_001476 [Dissostichus eleginoides]